MKYEKSKQKIRESFIRLYSKYDINEISIIMLCENSRVSRSTFYRYYSDIYEVLEEIGNGILDKFIKIRANRCRNSFSNTKDYIQELLNCINQNADFIYCILVKERNGLFLCKWKKIIRQDLSEKYTKDHKQGEAILLKLEMIVYGVLGVFSYWLSHKSSCSDQLVLSALIDIWDHGKI
ncbi:probable dihydroxyacetone kinase regulator [uncultured Roseburia sp.]|uniref:TetR/AcrR family transcriptional regulator n=1 Tax=Brotonthovivens ammoniilytica TaxID=2981725 RepID=A0ABT2TJF2_9FIRM|nr:TetR/AcrR family transcriptional regulator [Brotonthovivens ammoniilytica]MCU6762291.1 TetR/AcrR family transcriptional regulator [Brotonthovivens ammoniilytica]SCI66861.1 probable dihydroxyacetone kinase regulator [uncultured Roseburia sp.]